MQQLRKVHLTICIFFNLLACCVSVDPITCCKMGFQYEIGPLWDCRRCGLQSVPPNPPAHAKAVSLRSNTIKTIPKGSFINYGNVEWLNLGNNSLTLQPGTAYFEDLPKLKHLFLLRNPICLTNLSEQNPEIFKSLAGNLIHINIHRIEYNAIDDRHFEEYPGKYLSPLRELYEATLPAVPFDKFGSYFSNLTKVHYLSFLGNMPGAKNLWTVMKNETFINMPHFKYITLIDSALRYIEPYAFQPLQNLQTIETFCSSFQAIELINAIENLPKPTLETLIFEYDKSLADVPCNKTFQALSNLLKVVMGIPLIVPHPNPFMLDLLPIFWESVHELEIIRPYTNSNVSAFFRNPLHSNGSPLHIKVSNGLWSIRDHADCTMSGSLTKVPDSEPESYITMHHYINLRPTQLSSSEPVSLINYSKQDQSKHDKETHFTAFNSSNLGSSYVNKNMVIKSMVKPHAVSPAENYSYTNPTAKADPRLSDGPGCYSSSFSMNMCYRLLSLTLAFCISYAESYEADLLILNSGLQGIHTELFNLTVNMFQNDTLPEDIVLQNLEEFKISGAGLHDLASRNMPKLRKYDISNNFMQDLCHTDALSRLQSLEVFNASNNILTCINLFSSINASNLTHIDISKNNLQNVPFSMISLNNLEILDLSENKIRYLSKTFMNQLTQQSHVQVDLSENLLSCSCGTDDIVFISWLIEHRSRFTDFVNYTCLYVNGIELKVEEISIPEYKAVCKSKLAVYIGVPVSCSVCVIILMTLCYKHRWRIMWYTYIITNCCKQSKHKGRKMNGNAALLWNDRQQAEEYDIFLGYQRDEFREISHVYEKLMSEQFSIIHQELFQWGASVFQESVNAIKQSQKILFLVTKEFAQCHVCDFQLHMALIKGKENVILLQMASEMELSRAGMQPFLRNLMQFDGTYEYADDDFFWNRLETSLRA